ncbi:unnamed protein product [Ilex paraguariensis]|uniref:Uncharacterized protein n=1 Tax=Ilex paraguariensis TaxID=185542 RepID=A0ABC8QQ47_9AQUA
MAESQKGASSSIKSKEKSSLLDLDIGKDFLSSWKSLNVTKDDTMDFDFGPVGKVKNKAFKDMDFTFDGDFDKLSSFRVDMSDIDMSSPLKKGGKLKERAKEDSVSGNNQEKADSFAFSFDFNELDNFSFEPSLTKKEKQPNKNQDREESTNKNECQSSGIRLTENIGALEDGTNLKLPESGGEISSTPDIEVGGVMDFASTIENLPSQSVANGIGPSKPATDDNCPSKSATLENKVASHGERTSPEKTISMNTEEMDQDMCHPEKTTSQETFQQRTMQYVSVQSLSENSSARDAASEFQEEVSSQQTKLGCISNSEQKVNVGVMTTSGSNDGNSPSEHLALQHTGSFPSDNGERSKFGGESHELLGDKDGAEPAESGSLFENTVGTDELREPMHDTKAYTENQYSTSEHFVAPLSSGTPVGSLMPVNERETGAIRSRFFRRSDETESQLEQALSTQTKTLLGSKKIGTRLLSPADERREHADAKDAQSGSKLVGISRLQPRESSARGEPVQSGSRTSIKGLNIIGRDGFNADGTQSGSNLIGASRPHDRDVTKGETASRINETNIKDHDAFSSGINAPSLSEQTNKSASQRSANPRLLVLGKKSIHNIKNTCVEGNKISPVTAARRAPDLTVLNLSRGNGAKHAPRNSTFQKDGRSLRSLDQNMDLQRREVSNITHSVDKEKQTPPTPPLKRKTFEESIGNSLTLNPSKRLLQSPRENRSLSYHLLSIWSNLTISVVSCT